MNALLRGLTRRAACASMAAVIVGNLLVTNAVLAEELTPTPVLMDLPDADSEFLRPRASLIGRLKDMVGKKKQALDGRVKRFRAGWRRLREQLRGVRTRVVRAGKLGLLSLLGRRLEEEEDRVHSLLTAYIDAHGVEKLLEVLENSNVNELEQVALMGRKVEDPVLQSQLMQRYVARQFLRMKKKLPKKKPGDVVRALERMEEGAAALEGSDPSPAEWTGVPDEVSPAPVYPPYYPVQDNREGRKSLSLKRILIAVVAGAGLVLSAYFSFVTASFAPFMGFIGTFVSLIARLRSNYQFGQPLIIQAPLHQGPYPAPPPTREPAPLDPGVVTFAAERLVNLNTADVEELQTLPCVGPTLARRIVAAREQAPLKDLQDLSRVKGFGPKKLRIIERFARFS